MLNVTVMILLFLNASFLASESVQMLSTSATNCSTDAEQPNISSNCTCTATTLRFLVLLPYYREFQAESSHVRLERCTSWDYLDNDIILPVLDLAVEQIHNRSDFHKLELSHKDELKRWRRTICTSR